MNIFAFLLTYIIFMIPTYLIRFAAFSAAVQSTNSEQDISNIGNAASLMMIACFLILALIAFFRGRRIEKPWLAAFPIVAGVFDVVLFFIPVVPTAMHILTIVLGCISKPNSETIKPTSES
ncbi:hypothetical protein [Hwanghaeella sp. LZ110]|uniref:hypothetical protein n=1 Tax=Hwanghaeella sp. LZ110 TaxID=3402810 RepID=UPI003B683AE4